ncbi:10605_t:CDS:2 [Entrophospora sp. SA101]|nr:10605_t:CDS:2 [Entrophospora sp. SA101]
MQSVFIPSDGDSSQDTQHDRTLAKKWNSERSRNQLHIHQPTFTSGRTNNNNYKWKKINEFFSHDITPSQLRENDNTDHENDVPTSPSQDAPECFDKLVDNPGVSLGKTWDTFTIDELTLQNVLSTILGVFDLTGQYKFSTKWNELFNAFRLDVGWKMVNLDQYEYDLFDNMEDLKAQQSLPVPSAHLTILDLYLEHLKLPINKGELLVASQERCRQEQDSNDECARVGEKTDIIIALPTGPALEGFICEVSGGLPAGDPKKIWTDKLKLMDGMRDMINRVMKIFPGLPPTDYMKVIVFGCQVIGLQVNLYAMDVRTSLIYCFGMIDKVSLPASTNELPAYEAVHTMLCSLEEQEVGDDENNEIIQALNAVNYSEDSYPPDKEEKPWSYQNQPSPTPFNYNEIKKNIQCHLSLFTKKQDTSS